MPHESEFYNNIYSEHESPFGGGRAEMIVQNILKYRSSGTVLELGAGEGRNALFLAEKGFKVTARDLSEVGMGKVSKRAIEKRLSIATEVRDIRELDARRNFDVLVCTYVLQHLSREDALKLIQQIQDRTNVEGLNAVTVFTKNGDFYNTNPDTENFYPSEGELKKLYEGWEILEYEEVEIEAFAKKPDGSPMLNVAAKIVARKPNL